MTPSYEVLAVKYGEWQTSRAQTYHTYNSYDEPDGPVLIDYFFWVLRNEQHTVLVDVGFRPEVARRRQRTLLTPVPTALRAVGVDPAAVSHVVLTHFHYDHIGNVDLFADAVLVAHADEYEFWTGPMGERTVFSSQVESDEVRLIEEARAQGRVRLVPGEDPAIPGVGFAALPGHTAGQLAVTVKSRDNGLVVLASDASHTYDEFEQDRPFHLAADLPGMYQGLAWLRDAATRATVVPGHDPDVMTRFPPYEHAPEIAVRIG